MIVREKPEGGLMLIAQSDHSRLVGQFAAHWGNPGDNPDFAAPQPNESVVRAATFHDFGWLRYETSPIIEPATGETPSFRTLVTTEAQIAAYQWCIDWLSEIDPYAGLIVSMHRTGLWRGRYGALEHPAMRAAQHLPPELHRFITENEARQASASTAYDARQLRFNYRLQQVWDHLGLYFSCQDPYQEYIEPVPTSLADAEGDGVRLTLTPLGTRRVRFSPYPFDIHPCPVQLLCKNLPQSRYPDTESFRRDYFKSETTLISFELV